MDKQNAIAVNTSEPDTATRDFFSNFGKYLLVTSAWIVLVMASCHFGLQWMFREDYATRANFGNQFAPVGVFVSGGSGFLLLITILQQFRNLRTQSEAIKLQQQAIALQQNALEHQLEAFRSQQEKSCLDDGELRRSNQLAGLGLQVELYKQRIAHLRARGEANGRNRPHLRRDHQETARLIGELETLLARHGISSGNS